MKISLVYYCADCDTTMEKFTESVHGQINFACVQKTIPCHKTKRCREMQLTNIAIPDILTKNNKVRLDG